MHFFCISKGKRHPKHKLTITICEESDMTGVVSRIEQCPVPVLPPDALRTYLKCDPKLFAPQLPQSVLRSEK